MSLSAHQTSDSAAEGEDHVVGWKLDPEQRRELLMQFPPRYKEPVADHVTLVSRASPHTEPPSKKTTGEIVGRADDGEGVEAMVVRIGESTDRPDGGTFHITWSLDSSRGRKAKESNDVIARLGWEPLELPMPILLAPACWPRRSAAAEVDGHGGTD